MTARPLMTMPGYGPGIEIAGRVTPEYAEILTPEAVAFAARLQRAFGGRRDELLARRAARQRELDAGKLPDFLARNARDPRGELDLRSRCRRTSRIAASRSPGRSTAR